MAWTQLPSEVVAAACRSSNLCLEEGILPKTSPRMLKEEGRVHSAQLTPDPLSEEASSSHPTFAFVHKPSQPCFKVHGFHLISRGCGADPGLVMSPALMSQDKQGSFPPLSCLACIRRGSPAVGGRGEATPRSKRKRSGFLLCPPPSQGTDSA